jgi:hypothetical protein
MAQRILEKNVQIRHNVILSECFQDLDKNSFESYD